MKRKTTGHSLRPKILIVDDVPANLAALRKLLSKIDCDVCSAANGNDALALTLEHDFALILLDVQMPEMDGYEVAQLLRGEERTSDVPIIFVTAAYKDEHHRLKGYDAGAVDYIEKPISEVLLLSKVRVFLELQNSRTSLRQLLGLIEETNLRLKEEVAVRRRSEEESQRLAGTVFATSAEGILVCDSKANIIAVNPAFTKITGYEPSEVIGRNPRLLNSGHQSSAFYDEMWHHLLGAGQWQGEIWNRRKNGDVYPEWLSIAAIREPDGTIGRYVGTFSDITQRKQDEAQIWRQANYDALTGLPNRALFLDRLSRAVAEARRERHRIAVMFVDLDNFKLVNDTLGHSIGDLLLQEAARRLSACVRDSDTVSRLGGDEFTIVLKGVTEESDAARVAEKVIAVLSQPFRLDEHQAMVGASIGITFFPDDALDEESLLRNADMAMYRAKEIGRKAYTFFTQDMNDRVQTLAALGNELRHAVERNEFVVYYQPIYDARSLTLEGAEALVRWHHPRLGLVPPGDFIPLAEETGLIGPLGDWVLRQACHDAVTWQRSNGPPLTVAVNLSNRQVKLGPQQVARHAAQVLAETGLRPSLLKFEITESFVIEETDEMLRWLRSIRETGIRLSIDDFGTGYSSLSYLRRLPVDIVKIDRSFVSDVSRNADDAALVRAIISMAHNLRMEVVAEGVETPNQLSFLQSADCDMVQGYYFHKPMPAVEFRRLLGRD
jgi:diguanylate cyclase (GGDEF)-like protein/PAS domain S-box-containing protein